MRKFCAVPIWFFVFFVNALVSRGQIVTYEFTGVVSEFAGSSVLSDIFDVNDPINGQFSWDLSTIGTPVGSSVEYAQPALEFSMSVDGTNFLSNSASYRIRIGDGLSDFFQAVSSWPNQPTTDAVLPAGNSMELLVLNLTDSSGTTLSGTALPTGLTLGDWPNNTSLTVSTIGSSGQSLMYGTLTSLTEANPIPEPSTYALMIGIGCLGLIVWKRRKSVADDD